MPDNISISMVAIIALNLAYIAAMIWGVKRYLRSKSKSN